MDRTEIRMRCLEAAQMATKTPQSVTTTPEAVVRWATTFELYVVGPDPIPAATTRAAIRKIAATPMAEI